MNIKQVDIAWLKPAEYNPRKDLKAGDPEYEALKRSVSEFGHVQIIVANKDGTVIGGHQTLKVLKDLGHTTAAAAVLDLDSKRERALNLALNRIHGAFDDQKLADVLRELHVDGFDPTLSGFTKDEIGDLLDLGQAEARDDELPPAGDREVKTRVGDTWICGDHRVHCGDSQDPKALAAALGGQAADLCVTSPPYNVGIAYKSFKDRQARDRYLGFIGAVGGAVFANLKPGRFIAWNIGVSPDTFPARQVVALEDAGFAFYRQIVWEKSGVPYPIFQATLRARRARHYTPNYKHELVQVLERLGADGTPQDTESDVGLGGGRPCWLCEGSGCVPDRELPLAEPHEVVDLMSKGKPEDGTTTWPPKRFQHDVWNINQAMATKDIKTMGKKSTGLEHGGKRANMVKEHPAVFPVELPWACMQFLTAPGELVLDPFGGAGSTMIAGEKSGRRVGLCELDPLYVTLAVDRWERYSGRSAHKEAR